MQQHAGSPDILDAMMQTFTSENMMATSVKSNGGSNRKTKSKASIAPRNRMEEYYKTIIVHHDH